MRVISLRDDGFRITLGCGKYRNSFNGARSQQKRVCWAPVTPIAYAVGWDGSPVKFAGKGLPLQLRHENRCLSCTSHWPATPHRLASHALCGHSLRTSRGSARRLTALRSRPCSIASTFDANSWTEQPVEHGAVDSLSHELQLSTTL